MNNAMVGPLDVRGRAVAHYFFEEIEKIAREIPGAGFATRALRAPGAIRELAQFETGQAARSAEAMPFYQRWGPQAFRASSQAKGRAGKLSAELQKNITEAQGTMANPRASAADREAAISYLEAAKVENPNISISGQITGRPRGGEVAPDFARQQELSGATRTGEFAAKPPDSPMVQKAKMIGGGLAAGAVATGAGGLYLNSKSNQTGGYGAY